MNEGCAVDRVGGLPSLSSNEVRLRNGVPCRTFGLRLVEVGTRRTPSLVGAGFKPVRGWLRGTGCQSDRVTRAGLKPAPTCAVPFHRLLNRGACFVLRLPMGAGSLSFAYAPSCASAHSATPSPDCVAASYSDFRRNPGCLSVERAGQRYVFPSDHAILGWCPIGPVGGLGYQPLCHGAGASASKQNAAAASGGREAQVNGWSG